MAEEITIVHNGVRLHTNLAQAAILANVAKSTFSRRWKQCKLMGRSDQVCFDMIKKEGSGNTKRRPDANPEGRTKQKIVRKESEINQRIKPWLDRFLLGIGRNLEKAG